MESDVRSYVIQALRPHSGFAVENLAQEGTPDVCSSIGWIECKWRQSLIGENDNRRIAIKYRKSQQLWARRWIAARGSILIVTVAGPEWFVHLGDWAHQYLPTATIRDFRLNASCHWAVRPSLHDLCNELERCHGL